MFTNSSIPYLDNSRPNPLFLIPPNGTLGSETTILLTVTIPNSTEQLSKNFDNDVRFINRVIDFLKDIKWIEQDHSGLFQMTDTARLKVHATKILV